MRARTLVLLLAVLSLSGCAAGEGHARSVAPSSPGPASAGPSGDGFHREDVSELVKKALMAREALVGVGIPGNSRDDLDEDFPTSAFCGLVPANEGRTGHVAHERNWAATDFLVSNTAHIYYRKTGAEAIAEARDNSQRCETYSLRYASGDTAVVHVLAPVEFPTPAGVDASFGRCFTEKAEGYDPEISCAIYLGRKQMASVVLLYGAPVGAEAAIRAKLLQIVPIAAAALAAAA